jgi:hypothetical protein
MQEMDSLNFFKTNIYGLAFGFGVSIMDNFDKQKFKNRNNI